ncbi:hypothetical protein K466DRAFT_395884 [Polyporus arcularius HHB13444]|uniref:Uncharacterized protein n=1 Tax=Polyporus arcularius HHB13444 TaxID=1314778 RepID=A0A5C3NVL6_9APHY|nr:hypothetical protein K466DRAFT_395884 [Polyporus arcularius HHB13444]
MFLNALYSQNSSSARRQRGSLFMKPCRRCYSKHRALMSDDVQGSLSELRSLSESPRLISNGRRPYLRLIVLLHPCVLCYVRCQPDPEWRVNNVLLTESPR